MTFFKRIVFVFCCFFVCVSGQNVNLNESPCGSIFHFEMEGNQLVGILKILFPRQSVNTINVEFDIVSQSQGYGSLNLMESNDKVADRILNNQPVFYKLRFPPYWTIQPKIKKIIQNDNIICVGPEIPVSHTYVKKTIFLHYTFTLSTPLAINSNQPTYDFNQPGTINYVNRGSHPSQPLFETTTEWISGDDEPNFEIISFNQLPGSGTGQKPNRWIYTPHEEPNKPSISFNQPTTEQPIIVQTPRVPPPVVNTDGRFNNVERPQKFNGNKPNIPTRKPSVANAETTRPAGNFSSNDVCGVPQRTGGQPLIVGGLDIVKGEYPWLAAMYTSAKKGKWDYRCAGNLVSRKHLITAAHCCEYEASGQSISPTKMIFALGLYDLGRFASEQGSIYEQVKYIRLHIDYKYGTADADIAVIGLMRSIQYTDVIRPICLWPSELGDSMVNLEAEKGTIAGWGKSETADISSKPTAVSIPVVSNEDCLRSNGAFSHITSKRCFCAGEKDNRGPCNGDSGSGFMMRKKSVWYLRGIVSRSLDKSRTGICDLNNYVVFGDIVPFRSWIQQQMEF